jgi:hypothetical protein
MSRGNLYVVPSREPADLSSDGPRRGRHAGDPRKGTDAETGQVIPRRGHPDHGLALSLRRQPVRLVKGRIVGGYTGAFELICSHCGDHPYLDYSQVSPRLRRLRGPFNTIEEGLAAYDEHLGLAE